MKIFLLENLCFALFSTVVVLENSTQKLTCSSSFGNVGGCKGQILMGLATSESFTWKVEREQS